MSEWSFITAQHFFRAYSVSSNCWPPKWWRRSSWDQRLCICQVVSFSLYSADQTELRSMEKKGLWKILYLYIHCPPIEWNSLFFSCEYAVINQEVSAMPVTCSPTGIIGTSVTEQHPGSGRSRSRRNGNLLQYSCLKNPMDRGAWQTRVREIAKNRHDWALTLSLSGPYGAFVDQHPSPQYPLPASCL